MRRTSLGLLLGVVLTGWTTVASAEPAFQVIDFATAGGIRARADLYSPNHESSTLIILFHQAGWSRGEYREIAPKLVALGYKVLAVDQRSGRGVNGVRNATFRRATTRRLKTGYLDAYPDLVAALDYAVKTLAPRDIVVWGSSYSAALVFRLAAERADDVAAVLAFSPGEYFRRRQRSDYIQSFAKRVRDPVFVTSAKSERAQAKPIYDAVPAKEKILFTPASLGQHGSRALWAKWSDNDVYWAAVIAFLKEYVPADGRQ